MRMRTLSTTTTIHNNSVTINKPLGSILTMTLLLIMSHASTGFITYSTRRSITMRRNKTYQQSYHYYPGKLKIKQTYFMSNIEEEENNISSNNNKKRRKKKADLVDDNDNDNDNNNDGESTVPTTSMLVADVRGRPAGVVIDDLNWRVEKLRLEEANKRRFLKSGPRFLPYDECRKWVQAWGERWISSEEWYVCIRWNVVMLVIIIT